MGCCTSRGDYLGFSKKDKVIEFLEESRLNRFTYAEILRIDTQILEERIKAEVFEMFIKNWNVKVGFDFLSVQGAVNKFDLKVALLLFSKESIERKRALFEAIVNSPRKIMRFLEWRYQLVNERIPLELVRLGKTEAEGIHVKIEKYRMTAYLEINFFYSFIVADLSSLHGYGLLSIIK